MPGSSGPFCFIFLAWSNCPRVSNCFCSAYLACCTLARKVLGGLLVEPLLGPLHSFPAVGAPLGAPPTCWGTLLPPHWVDSWFHSEPLVPLGGKGSSALTAGMPLACQIQQGSWFLLPQSGLWGRHCQFRGACCPLFFILESSSCRAS